MPEHTTTIWTCSRCGVVEEAEGTGQPKDWTRVGFVNPPKASWSDKVIPLGDLCNGPFCGGLLVAFVNGTDDVEAKRIADFEAAMRRVERGDRIDPITAMKNASDRGPCPADCPDPRKGPHWHNYIDALKAAGFTFAEASSDTDDSGDSDRPRPSTLGPQQGDA